MWKELSSIQICAELTGHLKGRIKEYEGRDPEVQVKNCKGLVHVNVIWSAVSASWQWKFGSYPSHTLEYRGSILPDYSISKDCFSGPWEWHSWVVGIHIPLKGQRKHSQFWTLCIEWSKKEEVRAYHQTWLEQTIDSLGSI